MSHLGGKAEVWGDCPCPNVDPPQLIAVYKYDASNVFRVRKKIKVTVIYGSGHDFTNDTVLYLN